MSVVPVNYLHLYVFILEDSVVGRYRSQQITVISILRDLLAIVWRYLDTNGTYTRTVVVSSHWSDVFKTREKPAYVLDNRQLLPKTIL